MRRVVRNVALTLCLPIREIGSRKRSDQGPHEKTAYHNLTSPDEKETNPSSAPQVYEPLLVLGLDKFANIDIRVRVTGGGHTSQIYAIRQAIAKSVVAYYQKFVDEHSKNMLKQALVQFDRTLLVADNRRCEPKKFGGKGARSRFQKSYR